MIETHDLFPGGRDDLPQGGADDLPPAGAVERLDPRYVTLQRRAAWLHTVIWGGVLAVAGAVAVLALNFPLEPVLVPGTLLILLALRGQLWPGVAYRHASYMVDDWGVEVRRGVLWRRVMVVPRSRVQHTDVSRGPMERSLGLATLTLYTAGTSHTSIELPGLTLERAEAIRAHLVRGQEGDAV